MGHLLGSINAEAAARIQPEPAAARSPEVGELVIYHMRPGERRQGRTTFPALVQGAGDRGLLNLTVILEAGELKNETLVGEIGPGRDAHVWERPDNSALAEVFRGTITSLHTRIGDLETEMKALRASLLGDFNMPGLSLVDILARLEKRVIQLEAKKKQK